MDESERAAAHRQFSVRCFNQAWELIDQQQWTTADAQTMLQLAYTSLWHWTQREDAKPSQLSIGYWQIARVHALLGHAAAAEAAAERCRDVTPAGQPFLEGYAAEASARAALVAGRTQACQQYLQRARSFAAEVTNAEERGLLEADLETITP